MPSGLLDTAMIRTGRAALNNRVDFFEKLHLARNGSERELGELLESCRRYLALVAADGAARELRAKAGISDLVQETFLKAKRGFADFRGNTEDEWKAWLVQILIHTRLNFERRFFDTGRRMLAREIASSDSRLAEYCSDGMSAPHTSPSSHLRQDEELERLFAAMRQLPEKYRRAIELRQHSNLSFSEVGARLGVTAEAARKIWARALVELRQELTTRSNRPATR